MAFGVRDITKGQVAAYLFMPQVLPRVRSLYQEGFSGLAYLIALVYRAVNLLPANHPVLQRRNRNTLGLREVLGAAAAELKFSRDHIDQIVIYFAILLGLVLLVLQFVMTIGFLMMNPAMAQDLPQTYAEFFATPKYETDVAYGMLFSVFGVPELFKPGAAHTQFHTALHALFQFYSIGLLVVAVIIVCYYIFAILVETAQTGVPFGRRYNHVWTPIRLVFALGLLIPIGYGLNAAQWITLYSAKFGSDFATQGWVKFNDKMKSSFLENPEQRVGKPQPPELVNLAGYMMVVGTCVQGYQKLYGGTKPVQILGYLVKPTTAGGGVAKSLFGASFEDARDYFNKGDILIRFGEHSPEKHGKHMGNVAPYCGDVLIQAADATEPGSLSIQKFYYELIRKIYRGEYDIKKYGENFFDKYVTQQNIRNPEADLPPATWKADVSQKLTKAAEDAIAEAVKEQGGSKTWDKQDAKIQELGWGGAGIWYNKIAQVNGSLVAAVGNIPQIRSMPSVMEYIRVKQLQQNNNMPNAFASLFLADGQQMTFDSEADKIIGSSLVITYRYWSGDNINQSGQGNQTAATGNFFIDAINLVFGTRGLFNMCANADTHPLAQLSILGKGLMEASIRNLGLGLGFMLGTVMDNAIGAAMGAASKILLSVASITITMGFMLFYVVPFMPFLYFFFAVAGWIKGLFEAMVGVPLWALAHLRIDGEGLHGDAGIRGVYLIFEIFLRPILIVFGLLASVIIFAAMVKVLNEIFALAVTNLAGHDQSFSELCGKSLQGGGAASGGDSASGNSSSSIQFYRGPIDELFFTIMYAIIVYMIGMSCFKLIDLVPNNILRYMGADVQTFNDGAGDPTEGMMAKLSVATSQVSSQVFGNDGIISSGVSSVTSGLKTITK